MGVYAKRSAVCVGRNPRNTSADGVSNRDLSRRKSTAVSAVELLRSTMTSLRISVLAHGRSTLTLVSSPSCSLDKSIFDTGIRSENPLLCRLLLETTEERNLVYSRVTDTRSPN